MEKNKREILIDRNKIGMISGVFSIVLNLILSGLKIVVGSLVFSISMVADGFNNLADMASNVASMIGFYLAKKPADAEHPFGHARFEYIAGLVISILIFFAAFSLFWESLLGIFSGSNVEFSIVALAVLGLSIAVKICMGVVNLSLSKKINSKTLKAVAIDSFSDTIATLGVIISMLLVHWFDINIDGFVGCVVSVVIFISGLNVQKDVLSSLLGERITAEQAREMHDVICGFSGVLGIHDLIVHSYGEGNTYASAHVEMDAKIPPLESHEIIDEIEREFARAGVHMVLHYDPVELDNEKTNAHRNRVLEILSSVSSQIKIHDFRAVYSNSHTNLVFDLVLPYNFTMSQEEVITLLKNELAKGEEKIFLVVEVDREF
ncbi:MAG: cation diffusion facilitator family transporter [Bacillota bacterium]